MKKNIHFTFVTTFTKPIFIAFTSKTGFQIDVDTLPMVTWIVSAVYKKRKSRGFYKLKIQI